MLEGELEVSIDGETQVAGPGAVAVVPANTTHGVGARCAGRAIVANHPVRHDFH